MKRSLFSSNTKLHVNLFIIILIIFSTVPACDFFDSDKAKQRIGLGTDDAYQPPEGFQTQVQGNRITLTWQHFPDEEYNLYMASEPGVTPLTVDKLKNGIVHKSVNSPFTISGLLEGTTYYFVITKIKDNVESEPSIEISATPVSLAPTAKLDIAIEPPKNLLASPGDGEITLTWEPVPDALQYNLYMATEYGINPELYRQLHNGMAHLNVTSPYTIYGLKNHVVHYFVVAAVDKNGEGPISAEVFATPTPPERPPIPGNFSAKPGNEQITLYWDINSETERYNVYVATEPGVSVKSYSRLPGSMTVRNINSPYVLRGLSNDVNYYVILTGETDTGGESEATAELVVTPRLPQLPPPANVQVLSSDRKLTISWQESRGAESYSLYMAKQAGVSPGTIEDFTDSVVFENVTSPFIISELQNETTYYLVVTATNEIQESKPSEEKTGTPQKPYIPPPPRSTASVKNYTTLDDNGKPFKDQNKSYSLQPWRCVQSKKTGLVWEVKHNKEGLQFKNNTYSWFISNNSVNKGIPGVVNGGNCTGSNCDISGYLAAINKRKLCGYNDWRIPTRQELLTLVDEKAVYPKPTIDIDAFPNTASSYYWTNSVYDFNPKMAWFIYFGSGYDYYEYKTFASHIRLVRGTQK